MKIGRAGGRKIANVGIIRSLPEVHVVHDLWNDPIQVHIALAMGMCGEIHGHAIDARRKIGPMVQVETA